MTLSFDLHYTLNSYMNSVLQPIVTKICEICSENNFKDYTSVLPEIFKVITYSTDSAATNIDTLKNGTLSVSVDDPADTTFHSIKIVDSVIYAYLTYDPNYFMSYIDRPEFKANGAIDDAIGQMSATATKVRGEDTNNHQ